MGLDRLELEVDVFIASGRFISGLNSVGPAFFDGAGSKRAFLAASFLGFGACGAAWEFLELLIWEAKRSTKSLKI